MIDKVSPSPEPLKSPVLFLVFNRPDLTKEVFEQIKKARPPRLFIAADGPRKSHSGEVEKCKEVRNIVAEIDWDCKVHTMFKEKNVGCKWGPYSAINWFFENEEMGIILEDDCLPSQSFFRFCEDILNYYKEDDRMMNISGNNFHYGIKRGDGADYYFSKYNQTWGWATWKRAWKYCDINMKTFDNFKNQGQIRNVFDTKKEQDYWMRKFEAAYKDEIDAWDYQWMFSRIIAGGFSIHPNENLVQNIGFRKDATHTKSVHNKIRNNVHREIKFPLSHPEFVLVDKEADDFIFNDRYSPSFQTRVLRKIERVLKND